MALASIQLASFRFVKVDEIVEFVDEELEKYKNGEYAAAGSHEYAAQMIRQKKGDKLQAFSPGAFSGMDC